MERPPRERGMVRLERSAIQRLQTALERGNPVNLSAVMRSGSRAHRFLCAVVALCLAVTLAPMAPAWAEDGAPSNQKAASAAGAIGDAAAAASQPASDRFTLGDVRMARALAAPSAAARAATSGTWGAITWTVSNGTLTLSGSGAVAPRTAYDEPGYLAFAFGITKVVVGEGITALGDALFFQLHNVKEATLPSTLTFIGEGLFAECYGLARVNIPAKVTTIGAFAFQDCALTSVTLPEGLQTIDSYAFVRCTGLKSVRIPSTVTRMGEEAFPATTKLTNLPSGLTRMEDGSYRLLAKVAMKGKQMYSYAFQVLDKVNAERKKAGLKALSMDVNLLDAAMQRAMETTLYWSHTRPSDSSCFTVSDLMSGENIAVGQGSPASVMSSWMNSPGHRANILSGGYTSLGVGCVQVDGRLYWVQCFGSSKATVASKGSYRDGAKTRNVYVTLTKPFYQPKIKFSATRLKKKGATANVTCTWNNGFATVKVPATALVYKSSKPSVVSASKGVLKAKKSSGSATVKVYFPGYEKGGVSKTITVSPLATPALKGVKNAKGKKAVVTWKKVSGVAGYQVWYSPSKKFKGAKKATVKKGKTVKKTLTKLKKGTTYYVKVRAYKKVGKKTYYSAWSTVKSVKVKK